MRRVHQSSLRPLFQPQLYTGAPALSHARQDRRRLTSYDGVWPKLEKLVLKFLAEPFHVPFLGFFRESEALCVGRRHLVKVLMLENFFIWSTTCGVSRQRKCSNRVTVVGKVPGNEILALGLLLFIPILNIILKSSIDNQYS